MGVTHSFIHAVIAINVNVENVWWSDSCTFFDILVIRILLLNLRKSLHFLFTKAQEGKRLQKQALSKSWHRQDCKFVVVGANVRSSCLLIRKICDPSVSYSFQEKQLHLKSSHRSEECNVRASQESIYARRQKEFWIWEEIFTFISIFSFEGLSMYQLSHHHPLELWKY